MLKLKNVSKFYYNKGIIASGFTKVNLELKIGEFVVITGESGSGKSTLLNVISGLDSYEEGEMYINGNETSHYTEKDFEDYRRKYIANIFQSFNLINSYTVYQNVELVMLLNGYKKHKVKKKILDIIDQVGLTKFKNTKVSKLSGGQKQRVAIARAMVKDTPIIVADEPTGNLDSKSANEVIEILKKVAKDKLVVVVTHNIEQVEQYATRIIKMNDGRIIENTEIKKITDEPKPQESEYNNISIFNKYRLGVRNTFNIATKFLLLFAVFFFMSSAILAEYSSFQMSEEEVADEGYSIAFRDLSENRILINKKDKTSFTNEDYDKIKLLSNVDYIVEDDVFLDSGVSIARDDINFYGNMLDINNFTGNIDIGRMPENEDEIVLKISKDHFYINEMLDEILNKTFSVLKSEGRDGFSDEKVKDLIIVGIQYNEDNFDYDCKYYVSKSLLNELRSVMNKNYSNMKIFLNNKYEQYNVEPSYKVESGKVAVDDELKYSFKNYRILNQPLNIYVSNIYYEAELDLSITNTYTKSNFKRLTGLDKYDYNRYTIFVNIDDYNSLYNKPSYQSSVFVKDAKMIDETIQELENLGLTPKKVTDFKMNEGEIYKRIIKIIKVIVTIILIIVLFFISYLIIKIILKSRNVYYTTLRMLGATYRNVKRILDIELFVNSTLAYSVLMLFIHAVKSNIVNLEHIAKLSGYLSVREYVLMYIILIAISRLISAKFARKLFKNTAINTYNEEV
ncbi:MAG: ABC transporter ATP-binding protein [Clostridia bacterium]|nr:ABC transporter ATP-binding protein [Clostridia bacterium]